MRQKPYWRHRISRAVLQDFGVERRNLFRHCVFKRYEQRHDVLWIFAVCSQGTVPAVRFCQATLRGYQEAPRRVEKIKDGAAAKGRAARPDWPGFAHLDSGLVLQSEEHVTLLFVKVARAHTEDDTETKKWRCSTPRPIFAMPRRPWPSELPSTRRPFEPKI